MQANQTNIFFRHDTFFGVCEGIGQDLGFNPNYLRIVFALTLLFAPKVVLSIYFGAGLVVAASRLLFPPRPVAKVQPLAAAMPSAIENDEPALVYAQAA